MKSKYIDGGSLKIFEDGTIFRRDKNGEFKEATKTHIKDGYVFTTALVRGKRKSYAVHRLMAEAFIPNPLKKEQVNHIDGDKSNFNLDNLEWVTAKENAQHAIETGLRKTLDTTPHKCILCNEKIMRTGMCLECYKARGKTKRTLRKKIELRMKFKKHFKDIELYKAKYQYVIRGRFIGRSYRSIAKNMGVSDMTVSKLAKQVLDKDKRIFKNEGQK